LAVLHLQLQGVEHLAEVLKLEVVEVQLKHLQV
jgi:hypothetical protein